ncbi:MAG: glycosyltransferase, partial [Deltaproteobacteria bacterium]|nr:glycosyltransferase [Deltaproteobacteria bacterium]
MRVLLLPHRYPPHGRGGVETWAAHLAAGLSERGVQVTVATRDDRDRPGRVPFSVREEHTTGGVPVFWIDHHHRDARTWRDTWADDRMEGALRSVFQAARPDVVHVGHPDGFGIAPLRLARELGVPLVVTLHDPKWFCGRGQMVPPGGGVCSRALEERCVRCLGGQLGRGPLRGALSRLAPRRLLSTAQVHGETRPIEGRPDPGSLARRRWRVRQAALLGMLTGADAVLSPSRHLADV